MKVEQPDTTNAVSSFSVTGSSFDNVTGSALANGFATVADAPANYWGDPGGPVVGAKAAAILDGRHEARLEDVRLVSQAVLGHRIMPNFAAEAENVSTEQIVNDLLKAVA